MSEGSMSPPRHHYWPGDRRRVAMTVTAISGVTLDGVFQAPARPDEDTRDGFTRGGWAVPYGDEAATAAWGEIIARATGGGGFLFGRRTYLDIMEAWSKRAPDH